MDLSNRTGWSTGSSLAYMKELAAYWTDEFDWQKVEDQINFYPNFLTEIDGKQIHFIHVKGKGRKSIPLLITHGWPGSFLEMLKIIPLLTDHQDFSFDVIIPSLPGFGFSEKVTATGCNSRYVASLWYQLMQQLGYKQVGLQGGDIGAGVSTAFALQYPEATLGLMLNYIPGSYQPFLKEGEVFTAEELTYKKYIADWFAKEGAYAHLHSTKPLTLVYGLNDSPVGLCAWMLEKFYAWSDCNGNLDSIFTKDELLGNITLYWFTETIHSSVYIYYENSKSPLVFGKEDFVKCPVGIVKFPKEISFPPRIYVERGYNVTYWNEHQQGGHFAALEQPELLSKDIIRFFKQINV
ncbi:epoxide hydrolase family protein [uncultured Mucilaginibacter sp.]|uniref:epoxide hydrolase family protein n=1 Tax=uncultured Mucilaginibacter sp. TaxID=797541 RepID=UPI00262E74F5|nr:epoxide hydrolase family protein [uncultured Mucilaginibacter sp.]